MILAVSQSLADTGEGIGHYGAQDGKKLRHSFRSSPDMRAIESRSRVALMREMRNPYKLLFGKSEGNKTEEYEWVHTARDGDQ